MDQELLGQLSDRLDLQNRMDRHPYQTLLVAAGIGFVVSGALFSRFSMRVIGVGLRVAVLPILEEQLQAAARSTVRSHDIEAS